MAPWLRMVTDGARSFMLEVLLPYVDLRALPEERRRLTWPALGVLLHVTRCDVCVGI